jgi:MFS family permease
MASRFFPAVPLLPCGTLGKIVFARRNFNMTISGVAAEELDRKVMAPIFAIAAVDTIGVGIILPLLPFYTVSFGATPFVLGLLVALFSACQFIAAPILGKLSDRYGRKPILMISQFGTMLSFVAMALAGHLWVVFAARALGGLASGNISVVSAAAIDYSTPATRRQAIGVVSAAIGVGIMIGPALPALLNSSGPQASMWLAAGFAGLSIVLTWLFLPPDKNKAAANGQPKPKLTAILTQKPTLAVLAMLGFIYLALAMYLGQVALFAQERIRIEGSTFGPRETGYAFAAVGAINIFVQLFALRRIGTVFSERQLVFLSLGLLVSGYAVLAFASEPWGYGAATGLCAFGTAVARPTLVAAASLTVPPTQQGALMGVNQSLMAATNVVGPIIAGVLITAGLFAGWALSLAALILVAALVAGLIFAKGLWPQPTKS